MKYPTATAQPRTVTFGRGSAAVRAQEADFVAFFADQLALPLR